MIEPVIASGLLTASSVMVVGLTFVFDRIEVPRERRAKIMLSGAMFVGYSSALWCLYVVALPTGALSDLVSAETLFRISIGSMTLFLMLMATALFPDEIMAFLE